ncbi:hypothetical protein [Methanomethylophilus alvi]|uniref:hypothetical protein n=1 Tax=Methanomethylophilus alvi TaxID=1291540 RepID=UPI0037DDD6B4
MKVPKGMCAIVTSLIIILMVVVGEVVTYSHPYNYSASAYGDGSYSISDSGSHVYDAILTDNGGFEVPDSIYLFYDDRYGCVFNDTTIETGSRQLDQEYYVSQLTNNLKYYGVSVTTMDADTLATLLRDTGSAVGKGVVILAGAIPDVMYGESSTLLIDWIVAGGSLYWAGGMIGKYVAHSDGRVTEFSGDYQSLFFGVNCLNPAINDEGGRVGVADGVISASGNEYADHLSLKNNRVLYGVDTSLLAVRNLAIGYTDGTYSSIAFVEKGAGMICVVAGDYSNEQRMDLATVVASGLCYCSIEIEHNSGKVTRETISGTFERVSEVSGNGAVFIYLGGDFSVYGGAFKI